MCVYVYTVQPDSRVIRGCGFDDTAYNETCYRVGNMGLRQVVCACSENKCNGADHLQITWGLLMVVVAVAINLLRSGISF